MSRCPYCGAKILLKDATYIYHKKKAKEWGKVWVCANYPSCNSYVCCHKGTDLPLGRLANERLRCLKSEAHLQFDVLWKSGLMNRREAYKWLSDMLKIELEDCHIGLFDIKMCQKVIHLCGKQNNEVLNKYREDNKIKRPFAKRRKK